MKSTLQAFPHGVALGDNSAGATANKWVSQVGFWSALLATLLNIAFTVALIAFPGTTWRGMYEFAASFKGIDLLPALPAFVLAPAIVALFAAIHYYAAPAKKVLSQMGLIFAGMYGALTGINYFVQMTVVRQHILAGETAGLALFVMANPGSAMLAIDTLGYFFLFLAALFVAPVFENGKSDVVVRWLLASTGTLGLVGVLGYLLDNQAISFVGLILSGLVFLPATAMLALLFKRIPDTPS